MERGDLVQQLANVARDLSSVGSTASAEPQLTSVCSAARIAFGAAAVSVAVVEPGGLRYAAASGVGADEIVGTVMPIERGLAGYVAVSGRSMAVERPADDPRFARDVAERTGLVPSSMLLAPVRDEAGEVIAVMSVLDRSASTSDALETATGFTELLATILPGVLRTSAQAGAVLAAISSAVRAGDEDLADAFDRVTDEDESVDPDIAAAAATLLRLRAVDPELRAQAVRLIGEVLDLVTSKRRR